MNKEIVCGRCNSIKFVVRQSIDGKSWFASCADCGLIYHLTKNGRDSIYADNVPPQPTKP